jgi:osmotically-inducible protein OsmY
MKSNAKYSLALAVAAAAVFFTSVPVRASEVSDDAIESSFKNSYVNRTYLKDDAIKVDASDGVVTLKGTVAGDSHRILAQDTASSVPGVIRVDNQLATKAEVAADNADTWIARKVDMALRFRRNVNAGKTVIEVKDGVVTLSGEASSMAQKDLTTEYAKDINGVKSVKNQMTVAVTPEMPERTAGEKLDDASVTAQVRSALSTHRSTSSARTEVVTRDGAVTLTGIAKNAAEKSLVTKLVTDIHGVSSVNNEMTIEAAKTI